MLLADPGDDITASFNVVGMMHGSSVTQEFSVFCFVFQLLNTLKECLLSFLTLTIWMFHIEKKFCSSGGNYHPKTTLRSPALNNHFESDDEIAGNEVPCSGITVTLLGATRTI